MLRETKYESKYQHPSLNSYYDSIARKKKGPEINKVKVTLSLKLRGRSD